MGGQDSSLAASALVSALERGLASTDAEERRVATTELGRVSVEDALPLLLRALADVDWRVRKEATIAARSFGPARPLVAALVHALGEVEDVGLRNAAVDVLASAGPAAMEAVAGAYPKLDADGRKLAVDALGRSGSIATLAPLEVALHDVDPNVRVAAVEAIAGLGEAVKMGDTPIPAARDQVASILLRVLASPRDAGAPVQMLAALDGLTALGVAAPWGVVAPLFEDPTRRAAALAAAALSDSPEAARAVAGVLIATRTQSSLFGRAVRALGALASPDKPHLVPIVRDALAGAEPELGVRLIAAAQSGPHGAAPSSRDPRPGAASIQPPSAAGDEETELRQMAVRLSALLNFADIIHVAISMLSEDALAGEAQRALVTLCSQAPGSVASDAASALRVLCDELKDTTVPPEARGVIVDVIVDVIEASSGGHDGGGSPTPGPIGAALASLREAARDPEWHVAVRALRGLSRVGGEEDLALVAAETLAGMAAVGAAAEGSLLSLAARYPEASRALVACLRSDPLRALPAALLIGGAAAGSPFSEQDTTFLAQAATAGDRRARRAAVEAVAALRVAVGAAYPGALEVLGFALTDEEHDVRIAAARALGRLCSAPDAPRASDVLELVDRSGAVDLLAAAVRAIGQGMTASAGKAVRAGKPPPPADLVAALALFARSAPSQVALAAVDALAEARRSGAPAAISALGAAIDHPDEAVAKAALLKIAAHGANAHSTSGEAPMYPLEADLEAVTAALVRGLDHGTPSLRALAVESLGEQGSSAARAELARRLGTEPDAHVAEAIRRALARGAEAGG